MNDNMRNNGLEVRHLRDAAGSQVQWYDQTLNQMEQYDIMTEMDVAGQTYVVLSPSHSAIDPHPYIFTYTLSADGSHSLAPVDSEEDWDRAADAFIDWLTQ